MLFCRRQLSHLPADDVGDFFGRLKPLVGLLLQQTLNDSRQPGRDVRIQFFDRSRRVLGDAFDNGRQAIAAKRRSPGAHGVQDTAQAEQVAAVVDMFAASLFGRHVLWRAGDISDASDGHVVDGARNPKSVILTRSTPFSNRILAGLMSRWISPC